jgi:hypothetical protein
MVMEHTQAFTHVMVLYNRIKKKVKVYPRIGHECPEGEHRYSSTLSLTSALNGADE